MRDTERKLQDNIHGLIDDLRTILEHREFGRWIHAEERGIHVLSGQGIDVERCVVNAIFFQCKPDFLAVH